LSPLAWTLLTSASWPARLGNTLEAYGDGQRWSWRLSAMSDFLRRFGCFAIGVLQAAVTVQTNCREASLMVG
jgi:hypothetical protein